VVVALPHLGATLAFATGLVTIVKRDDDCLIYVLPSHEHIH